MVLTDRQRAYALFAIVVIACAFGSLTQTVMNSMLGGVEADFGVGAEVGQWLTTCYMLVLGITVPVVTYLSQRLSMRNLVFLALGFFGCGGLVALLAPNFGVLIVGRVLQAVSAGITTPLLQTIAMTRFPSEQTGTAMGIAGIAMGFAPNIGPFIGGALVDTLGWRSFYAILLCVLIVLALCTAFLVAREPAPALDASIDIASFLLSTLAFGGLLLGFTNASSMAIANPLVWLPCILGVVCLVAFLVRQRRIEHPLINLSIFSSASYRTSFVAQNFLFASFMGITLIVPLYVQGLCGDTALQAGLVFIPTTIFALFVNPLAGVLSDKLGARRVVVCAGVLLVVGAVGMVFMDATTPLWFVTLMQIVRGLGVSALIGPLNSWGLRELEFDVMMDGSAFFTAVRQACAALGTALMVLAITACSQPACVGVLGVAFGYRLAFGISALFACGLLIVAVRGVRD